MRKWDRVVALLLLGFAVYVIVVARGMVYLQGRVPGPGFAPFWIGTGLALAALLVLLGTFRRGAAATGLATETGKADRGEEGSPARLKALALIAAVVLASLALIRPLGLLATLGVMVLVLARILGASWRGALPLAVGLPAVFHLVFAMWFKVPLPRGPLGF